MIELIRLVVGRQILAIQAVLALSAFDHDRPLVQSNSDLAGHVPLTAGDIRHQVLV